MRIEEGLHVFTKQTKENFIAVTTLISLLQHLGIFKKKDLSTNSLHWRSFFFLNGVHLGCDQACFCLLCCPIWPGWLAIDWQPLDNMPIDNHFSSPVMIKCLLIAGDHRFHFHCYACFPNEDGRFSNYYFPSCSQQNFRKRFMTMWTLDKDHQLVFATSVVVVSPNLERVIWGDQKSAIPPHQSHSSRIWPYWKANGSHTLSNKLDQ